MRRNVVADVPFVMWLAHAMFFTSTVKFRERCCSIHGYPALNLVL